MFTLTAPDRAEDDTGYKPKIFILNSIIRVLYKMFYKLAYKLSEFTTPIPYRKEPWTGCVCELLMRRHL